MLGSDAYYALLEIFIFLAFAEILHSLTQRVGLPQIVADLITGLALGGYALGGVFNRLLGIQLFVINSYVLLFATFSVVLLLFAAGLAGGFSSLRKAGALAVFAAIAGDLLPFGLTLFVFSHFYPFQSALLLAGSSAATSVAVTAALIQTQGVGDTLGAKFYMNASAMDDVVALILLSVILSIVGGKFDIVTITGSVVESAAAWIVLVLASVLIVPRLLRLRGLRESRDVPFVVLFVLVAIVIALGFSAIIGAYIAGLAVAESLLAQRTRQLTDVLLAIFGSLFFVVVGAEFNLSLWRLPGVVGLGLLLTAFAVVGKLAGVYPFARWRLGVASKATAVAVGMVPRGEIGLLVGSVGLSIGLLRQAELGAIVLMALITTLLGAALFRKTASSLRLPDERREPAGSPTS